MAHQCSCTKSSIKHQLDLVKFAHGPSRVLGKSMDFPCAWLIRAITTGWGYIYNTVVSHSCHTVMLMEVFEKSSYSIISQASKVAQSNFLLDYLLLINRPNTLWYSTENNCTKEFTPWLYQVSDITHYWLVTNAKMWAFWQTFVSQKPSLVNRQGKVLRVKN